MPDKRFLAFLIDILKYPDEVISVTVGIIDVAPFNRLRRCRSSGEFFNGINPSVPNLVKF